jgi:hypothetical protein
MPPLVAAAVIALVEVGFTFATAIAITSAITTFAIGQLISAGIGLITASSGRKAGGTSVDRLADLSRFLTQSSVESHKIIYGTSRIAGNISFRGFSDSGEQKHTGGSFSTDTRTNLFQHLIVTLAGHESDSIPEIYLDGQLCTIDADGYVTNSDYTFGDIYGVRIIKHLGSPTQTADAKLVSEYADWTSDHRLRGITYIYIRFRMENFSDNIPTVNSVVKGAKVYDPRTATTAWSDNWALCCLDYLLNSQYGFGADISTEIDTTSFNAAANISDETVNILPSGTQKRYTANGIIDTAGILVDNLQSLISGGAGAIVYEQGRFKCFAAAYDTPAVPIDDSWFIGDLEILTRKPRTDLFNTVKGVFIDPAKDWAATDFPEITNATYQTQDGGEKIVSNIQLPFTTDIQRAQRIAKIILEKGRQGITATLNLNLKALPISVFDNVYITNTTLGWSSKVFRVLSWGVNPEGGVTITVQEESSASYDWASGEATVTDPAPDTNLPSPFIVPDITGLVLTSGTSTLYIREDGTVMSRIKATWDAISNPYVQFNGKVEIQYKPSANSEWEKNGYVGGGEIFDFILDVQDGEEYDVQVRAVNSFGNVSGWTTSLNHTVVGKTAPPSDVATFTIFQNFGALIFKWGFVSDIDLGGYEIRFSTNLTADWDSMIALTVVNAGTELTSLALPPAIYKLCIKARDTSANYSLNETCQIIEVTNNNDIIAEVSHYSAWLATKTNYFLDPLKGWLMPNDQDPATGNDFVVFDTFILNPYSTYSYEYIEIDIGLDNPVRLYSSLTYEAGVGMTGTPDIFQQIDYKTSSGSYDGYEDASNLGIVNARYAKYKFIQNYVSGDPVCYITEYKNVADAQERTESDNNVTIAIGGTAIVYDTPFVQIPSAGATAIGGSSLIAVISSPTTSGFTVKVYNTVTGADVGGTINWDATGV